MTSLQTNTNDEHHADGHRCSKDDNDKNDNRNRHDVIFEMGRIEYQNRRRRRNKKINCRNGNNRVIKTKHGTHIGRNAINRGNNRDRNRNNGINNNNRI